MIRNGNTVLKLIAVILAIAVFCSLAGCTGETAGPDSANGEAAAKEAQGNVEVSQEDPAVAAARKEAYLSAIQTLYDSGSFPDTEEFSYSNDLFAYEYSDRYAVCDVNGDGKEELILEHTDCSMAEKIASIYTYDSDTGTLTKISTEFPYLDFYSNGSNGIMLANLSHNQDLLSTMVWPYILKKYNAETGSYDEVCSVSGWDRTAGETDSAGTSFPTDTDQDGDGNVYVIADLEGNLTYLDKADYDAWFAQITEGAQEIEVPYQNVAYFNIKEYREGESSTSEIDLSSYESIVFKDLTVYLPPECAESLGYEMQSDDMIGFYHKETNQLYSELYQMTSSLFFIGRYDSIDELYDMPYGCRILEMNDETGEVYALLYTDLVYPPNYEYVQQARENGVEISEKYTEEYVNWMYEDMMEKFRCIEDLHVSLNTGE